MPNSSPASSPLAGQSAFITGASRGIGLAIACRLGQLGARVALCARHRESLEKAGASLRQEEIEAHIFVADVSHAAEISAAVESAIEALGPLDILVNNAGVGRFGPAHEFSETDWDTLLDTNLKGVFLTTRAVAPGMISRRRGHIINISSLAGKNAFAGGGVYCASKWGLQGLTFCMAEDLRAYGIRVAAVCPGSVATQFGVPAEVGLPAAAGKPGAAGPHTGKDPAKMLQPEDVAHAVAMLLTAAPQSFISEVLLRPTQKP